MIANKLSSRKLRFAKTVYKPLNQLEGFLLFLGSQLTSCQQFWQVAMISPSSSSYFQRLAVHFSHGFIAIFFCKVLHFLRPGTPRIFLEVILCGPLKRHELVQALIKPATEMMVPAQRQERPQLVDLLARVNESVLDGYPPGALRPLARAGFVVDAGVDDFA